MKKIYLISYKRYKGKRLMYIYIAIILFASLGVFGITKLNDILFKVIYLIILIAILLMILLVLKKRIVTLSGLKSINVLIEEYIFILTSNLGQIKSLIQRDKNKELRKKGITAHTTRIK